MEPVIGAPSMGRSAADKAGADGWIKPSENHNLVGGLVLPPAPAGRIPVGRMQ
jgi:hypothetical protein